MLSRIIAYIQKLALACAIGQMFFFAALFAPLVFRVLPREQAALLQNNLFPLYFGAGAVACAIVLLLHFVRGVLAPHQGERLRSHLTTALALIALLIFIYGKAILAPQVAAAYAAQTPDFAFLHRLSLQLNAAAFLALLGLLAII